ncbi:uncharacterized protein C8orf48 homolog [Pleurodeles waltl]|uniref:uncharacterized protein C8orf48 homolog n=1 Tax=Pleurodeles waltl TaxID=8319 RepID=UPI00370940C1
MVDQADRFGDSDVESIKTDPGTRNPESSYADDTFESITTESDASHVYDSEPFESYISAEETDSLSSSIAQVHPAKDGHSGFGKEPSVEKQRISKWIGALQEKTDNRQSKGVIKSLSGAGEEAADEGLDALQSFCFNKIRQIRHSVSSQRQDCRKKKKKQSRKADTSDVNSAAPSALVNRIYLNNLRETVKQVKELKMHEPSKCPDCLAKKANLAKIDFIRRRKTAVEEVLLQEKLEEQLYLKDSITLIGEIHRTLPKLSDDPQLVWQRLLEPRTT